MFKQFHFPSIPFFLLKCRETEMKITIAQKYQSKFEQKGVV